ncbi:MAG: nitrilase [Anaerolineae bacterium]|nr:nitrilase [Anaerolineae bacterium]
MRDLTVAAVNFRAEPGAIDDNLSRTEAWVARLADRGVEMVCFPEMSLCGYDHSPRARSFAQPVPGPITERLETLAARQGAVVLAGLAETDAAGRLFISQVIVGPEGLIGTYRKAHLGPFERETFSAGDEVPVFATDVCTFGVQLCYDTHFPEMSSIQGLAGAEVLFFPFASPHGDPQTRRERIMRYLPARAYDNACYVVTCNLTGQSAAGSRRSFPGTALIVSPKGELMNEQVGWEEGAAVATLSAAELRRIGGTRMGHFHDHRRPELYGALCRPTAEQHPSPGGERKAIPESEAGASTSLPDSTKEIVE